MLAIKQKEQAAYEALMNDPVSRRRLLKEAGQDIKPIEKERHKHKHRHHDDPDDHHRNYKRKRADDGDRHSRKSRRHEDEDRYHRRSYHDYHRRSDSSSYSRSPSLHHRQRSPSPYCRRRSPSPYDRQRRRSPSPIYRRSRPPIRPQQSQQNQQNIQRLNYSKSFPSNRPPPRRNTSSPEEKPKANTEDKAAKLAAMQADADDLENQRTSRLAALEDQEHKRQEIEEKARERSSKYGGRGDFVHSLNRKAGEMDIGQRMQRGRATLDKAVVDGD